MTAIDVAIDSAPPGATEAAGEQISDTRSADERPALRPFFGFYGGKWRDALKHYPAPTHDTIVEPFAGSAGYAIRYANRKVILGEIDPIIYGVWNYLVQVTAKDILAIPDLKEGQSVNDLKVSQEARWLVGFWLNRGTARPRTGNDRGPQPVNNLIGELELDVPVDRRTP